jgi:osmotically-inducible protein OsmY
MERATRWVIAALIGCAMTSVGCERAHQRRSHLHEHQLAQDRTPIVEDQSVVHAFDTDVELRLLDRLQLDNFLRERNIRLHVLDGEVSVTGEVWTSLEKERVSELIRGVPGVVDVANDLDIRPPR